MITINFALKVIHIYNRHADLVEQLRLPGMCSCFGWDKVIFLETISVILMLVMIMLTVLLQLASFVSTLYELIIIGRRFVGSHH